METFLLTNQVRLNISQALLLLYRYLTNIYMLGDLSFVQFLSGYAKSRKHRLEGSRVLSLSGNGIGELEKFVCLQWKPTRLETLTVTPAQMGLMRFFMETPRDEVKQFFQWAQDYLKSFPNLQTLFASPGLVAYWQQQCEIWQSSELKNRVFLFGGSAWDISPGETYDIILLSHAQKLFHEYDPKLLLSRLKPEGSIAALMPIIFRPDSLSETLPARFSDSPLVESAKLRMRTESQRLGYGMSDNTPVPIQWTPAQEDVMHVVSFSIPGPLRSLLVGELLIQSLSCDLPDITRLNLLESALGDISPGAGAGTEVLLILLTERGVASCQQ